MYFVLCARFVVFRMNRLSAPGRTNHHEVDLFRFVEVLVFIDNDVIVGAQHAAGRIPPQEAKCFRDEFPDQDCLVKPEPVEKCVVEEAINGFARPARFVGLKPCPRRFKRQNPLCTFAVLSQSWPVRL